MTALKGSERSPLPGAKDVGPADPAERLEVTLLLRRGGADDFKAKVAKLDGGDAPAAHMTREAFAAAYGAADAYIDAVQRFAQSRHLAVVSVAKERRAVVLSGTVAAFDKAFGVKLRRFEHPNGAYRGRVGSVQLPSALENVVKAVLGLDNRPQAKPHFRSGAAPKNVLWHARADAAASPTSFAPAELASLYSFPVGAGDGQCVALIELGGGYRPGDSGAYFAANSANPAPTVITVSVDHATNSPTGAANGPDGEVMLDIEVVGSVAPKAKVAVYFAPNTDAGFINAVGAAAHDAANKPSVISISWGGPESAWTSQAMTAFDEALQAAALMGVTVCIASGDDSSSDGVASGDHVNFPASSQHALACGGTSVQACGQSITSEMVWNDGPGGGASGGGVSAFFPLPTWQNGLTATKTGADAAALRTRGVPDVAGDADPETGYRVRVDGSDTVYGGTSAVAPLWAGLLARINAAKGQSAGFINPLLYANPKALKDITQGDNGDFSATAGWDACTGLGSPNGATLASLIGSPAG